MTTVICDGESMASDSLQAGVYIDQLGVQKIYDINDVLVGVAGDSFKCNLFIEWVKNGRVKDKYPKDMGKSFEGIILKNGLIKYYTEDQISVDTGKPAAIGTGGVFAMAACMAGADVKEAVEIACKLDVYSGGEVQFLTTIVDDDDLPF